MCAICKSDGTHIGKCVQNAGKSSESVRSESVVSVARVPRRALTTPPSLNAKDVPVIHPTAHAGNPFISASHVVSSRDASAHA